MGRAMILSMAVAMGMMLSPESLIVIGNGVGGGGVYFLLAVSLVTIFYVLNIMAHSVATVTGGEIRFLKATLGPVAAGASSLCSRVAFCICALPVLLSTAGFVFNETFQSWFPPFLFAHLLVIALAAVNIARRELAEWLQVVFVVLVVGGLVFLSVMGIARPPETYLVLAPSGLAGVVKAMTTAIVLFVGFDLMFLSGRHGADAARSAVTALMFTAMAFTLWSLASLFHVPLLKLSDSTIPYSIAARAIFGQPGRLVVGVVVIAGVAAAVNALLLGVGRMMTSMASEGLLPGVFLMGAKRDAASIIFLSGSAVAFMLLGYAGEERLLVYMKGALLFWLLHYAVLHLAVIFALRQKRGGSIFMMSLMGVVVFTVAFFGAVYVFEQRGELIRSMLYLMAACTGIVAIQVFINREKV